MQTWELFEKNKKDKKLFLYGVGVSADIVFARYGEDIVFEAAVDNDCRKQGFYLDDFVPEAFGCKNGRVEIRDSSVLRQYPADEVMILIASKNYDREIAEQLERMGIKNHYSVLEMEQHSRQRIVENNPTDRKDELQKEEFVRECCEQYAIENDKIFFRAFGDYADHGKYITEALLKSGEKLDIVWVVSDMAAVLPAGIRKIYSGNWKKYIYEMETAKIWVLDLEVPDHVCKREGQIYLQTKHWSSITLKRFYLDTSAFAQTPELIEMFRRESRIIDHIITGSEFDTESCRRGFGFQGEVLMFGSPRSDALFHEEENKKKIYARYHIDRKKHVLLYAPTYRFDKERGKTHMVQRQIELDFTRTKQALEQKFGGEWLIMVRLHPSVSSAFQNVERPDFVIDASAYNDSQELVSAADITISDFSSIMFEPAFVKKPVFLLATDLQDYLENEYDLLIEYHELPFPIAESNDELVQRIAEFDPPEYEKRVTAFLAHYGVHEDGHASERTARYMINLLRGQKSCRKLQ